MAGEAFEEAGVLHDAASIDFAVGSGFEFGVFVEAFSRVMPGVSWGSFWQGGHNRGVDF